MSRLFIVTRAELAHGFHLAGIDAFAVPDVETARELISGWMSAGETGLLALDDGLLARFEPAFIQRLDHATQLPYITIPGGEPLGVEFSRERRIADLIRRAVGMHISFKERKAEPS